MEILVCKDYDEFINKAQQIDKQVNGVSEEFLKQHRISIKNYLAMCQNSAIVYCFNCWNCEDCEKCINCESCVKCKECNGCEECVECNICEKCIGCKNCEQCLNSTWCEKCVNTKGFSKNCFNCKDCDECASCSNCIDCVKCRNCINCKNCNSCSNCLHCKRCENCKLIEYAGDFINTEKDDPNYFQEYLKKEYNGDYAKYQYCSQGRWD